MASTDRELSKWKLEESEWEQIKEIQGVLKVGKYYLYWQYLYYTH